MRSCTPNLPPSLIVHVFTKAFKTPGHMSYVTLPVQPVGSRHVAPWLSNEQAHHVLKTGMPISECWVLRLAMTAAQSLSVACWT